MLFKMAKMASFSWLIGLAFCCFLQFGFAQLKDVYIQPPVRSNGPETLLVCIPGMDVPGLSYLPLCERIASTLSFRTWIAVLSFPGDYVTPLGIEQGLDQAADLVKKEGFQNVTYKDTFVCAHSAGGAFGSQIVAERLYAGYLIYGSYVNGISLADFPIPVLTVSGELDGLAQTSRVAEEYRTCRDLLDQGNEDVAVALKPVVIVLGTNHAQTCNDYPAPVLVMQDISPEISLEQALHDLAKVAVEFIELHRNPDESRRQQGFDFLHHAITNVSHPILNPFLIGQDDDRSEWCARSQRIVANLGQDQQSLLMVENVIETDFDAFVESKANLEVISGVAHVETHNYENFSPFSTIQSSGRYASEVGCKMKTQESIVEALQISSGPGVAGICRDVHLSIYDWALRHVAPRTRERFLNKGKQLLFLDDQVQATGAAWVDSHLIFDESFDPAQVSASRLTSGNFPGAFGGANYCKGVSAARIVAWLLHNSLPRGLNN